VIPINPDAIMQIATHFQPLEHIDPDKWVCETCGDHVEFGMGFCDPCRIEVRHELGFDSGDDEKWKPYHKAAY